MGLISDGIEKVTAYRVPVGISEAGEGVAEPGAAIVRWHSRWNDKLHQVYVNGRYAGVTVEPLQRELLAAVPSGFDGTVRIEVFAVSPGEGYEDFSGELPAVQGQTGRVRIEVLRQQALPAGAKLNVYFDNGTGVIDYSQRVNAEDIFVWPGPAGKCGFGMCGFGRSDFGYDGSAAVGFGRGVFGQGWFGFDADKLSWVSDCLAAGTYRFAVKVVDAAGNESQAAETAPITVLPAAKAAKGLEIVSFDEASNELLLEVLR